MSWSDILLLQFFAITLLSFACVLLVIWYVYSAFCHYSRNEDVCIHGCNEDSRDIQ